MQPKNGVEEEDVGFRREKERGKNASQTVQTFSFPPQAAIIEYSVTVCSLIYFFPP